MIEAVEDLENDLDKPVMNSNQATLWACLSANSALSTPKKNSAGYFSNPAEFSKRVISRFAANFSLPKTVTPRSAVELSGQNSTRLRQRRKFFHQAGVAFLDAKIANRHRQCFAAADDDNQLLAARHAV